MPVLALALAGLAVTTGSASAADDPAASRPSAASARRRWSSPTRSRNCRHRVRALRARGDRYRPDQRRGARGAGGDARRAPAGTDPGRSLAGELLRRRGTEGRRADRRRDPGGDRRGLARLPGGDRSRPRLRRRDRTDGERSLRLAAALPALPGPVLRSAAAASPRPPRPAGDPRPQRSRCCSSTAPRSPPRSPTYPVLGYCFGCSVAGPGAERRACCCRGRRCAGSPSASWCSPPRWRST